ncbi:protein adenylyltransferase SelO [Flocculibacter collagenilyticus]|uniref:protein adenylyltransferase SelO n=1 Tax=Flocculibacter collagenilyticus TaxID=2744479 RepID=UPI0018F41C52|nr:YdiU family protein [Flocculibacter collagenilyticus]
MNDQSFSLDLTHSYFDQLSTFYSVVSPKPLVNPKMVIYSKDVASLLNIPTALLAQEDAAHYFSFNKKLPNSQPIAQKYAGHQFGSYNPELGDGRGLLIGEVSHNNRHWDLHIKGAGRTPYSRFGDGRAVLRSSIREFLASEALHYLGIPSSRALCLVASDEAVQRESIETAAMLTRVCQSHLRFGHFENYFYLQQHDKLKQLLDYTIARHFPACLTERSPYQAFFAHVVHSTAELIAKWQAFGFAHGVMNTDNMSIHGITFDYGPYGFMEQYDPAYICNHSDHTGRYAFEEQPSIGLWNLNALGHALSPFIAKDEIAETLADYEPILVSHYLSLMANKLGLDEWRQSDGALLKQLLDLMLQSKLDYTWFFRQFSHLNMEDECPTLADEFVDREAFYSWFKQYQHRVISISNKARKAQMLAANPKYILRNYLAQNAIEAAEQGDYSLIHQLHDVLSRPYDEQNKHDKLAQRPPDWAKNIEISCSS